MHCDLCGNILPQGALRCPYCGSATPYNNLASGGQVDFDRTTADTNPPLSQNASSMSTSGQTGRGTSPSEQLSFPAPQSYPQTPFPPSPPQPQIAPANSQSQSQFFSPASQPYPSPPLSSQDQSHPGTVEPLPRRLFPASQVPLSSPQQQVQQPFPPPQAQLPFDSAQSRFQRPFPPSQARSDFTDVQPQQTLFENPRAPFVSQEQLSFASQQTEQVANGFPQSPSLQMTYGAVQTQSPQIPFSTLQPLPGQQAPEPGLGSRRRGSGGMLVLIVALALLLVLGGGGLVYYTTVVQPSQMHAQATVTAQTMQTAQAAQATSTALSYVHATATTQAVATAQVVATATALNNIYTQATGGTPALNDALAQNSTSNWTVYANGGRSCAFRGGALHASVSQAPVAPCLALNSDFGNFAYQVQMTITSGNAQSVGGIIFRTQDFSGSLYWFAIATDGSYSLVLLKGNGSASGNVKILVEGSSPVVKTGLNSANVLTVVVRGNNFYMYINQQYVASATDSSFSAGKIGVLAGNEGNAATDVAFSNAKVWTL